MNIHDRQGGMSMKKSIKLAMTLVIALIVCATLLIIVLIAKTIGCTLPLCAAKLGFDPAVMAIPLITTIVDAISLVVYFMIASNVLHLNA